jgi:HSP20 family protein
MYTRRNFTVTPRTIGGFLEDVFQNGVNAVNEEVSAFAAPVNILETDKSYELHVVAPGLKKEDFKLNVERDVLTISADQNPENKEQEGKWLRSEFRKKSFKRTFTLNDKVDASKISAKYNDGILVVTLTKKEPSANPSQDIPVN